MVNFSSLKLGRALDYHEVIDIFVAWNRDLRDYELSENEWEDIILVTGWLKSFRSATTQMSTTKCSMLSNTHAIFQGLQDQLKAILSDLPSWTSPQLILGLTDAHTKLSDYYYKFDESPLYTWAAHMFSIHHITSIRSLMIYFVLKVLDPRISYEGMKLDYEDDISLAEYLESTKLLLHGYFSDNYAGKHAAASRSTFAGPSTSTVQSHLDSSPQKVNFTARYQKLPRASVNKLEEYFKLPREDFETCDPIKWWLGRRSQFPNLFVLARDLLAIPGEWSIQLSNQPDEKLMVLGGRLSSSSRTSFFRRSGHHFVAESQPSARNHQDLDAR
jgi:hypothetical protein